MGKVIWVTGLSASGKTTLGLELTNRLRKASPSVVFLDGDDLRIALGENTTHTREDRLRLAFIYGRVCRLLSSQGLTVVIATVALFKEIHAWNRKNLSQYFEIFLDVPISELRNRDPKGIYRKFDLGLIQNVAGLDMNVDYPVDPDLHVLFDPTVKTNDIADQVLSLVFPQK